MKIAIQGHPTRGKEVIQILESLGGIDMEGLTGTYKTFYYINHRNKISDTRKSSLISTHKCYTLEEFEKEFPFKIGDKVTVMTDAIYKVVALEYYMSELCYKLDNGLHYSSKLLTLYKEMKEERNVTLTLSKAKEWYKKGGELREVALQAFTEEELNPLPRSWEEYCKYNSILTTSFSGCAKYDAFVKLEHLRDCWLGGWTPKWDTSEKWCIRLYKNQLHVGLCTDISRFLTFPTKEMAENFLECFWDLIETARNLI